MIAGGPAAGLSRTIRVLPGPQAVARLLDEIASFCHQAGFDSVQQSEIQLILEELVTNAITHGQAPSMQPIDVLLAFDGEALDLRVRGQGVPFDPTLPVTPDIEQPLEERAIGGLGMFLVQQLCDTMAYTRIDGVNQLDIRKRMARGSGA